MHSCDRSFNDFSVKLIKARWSQLRDRYVRHHKEVHGPVPSGSGREAAQEKKREVAIRKFPLYTRLDAILARTTSIRKWLVYLHNVPNRHL